MPYTYEDVEAILRDREVTGGETSPDGDSVQVRMPDGTLMVLYLSESFGDELPSDDGILGTVEAAAPFPTPRWEAEPVTDADRPARVVCTKRISSQGTSLVITVTPEARMLGLDRGDSVEVTIRRI